MSEYLSIKRCFDEILNQNEIELIEESELRELRFEYWNKRHQAFLNEDELLDDKLVEIREKLVNEEQQKLLDYKKKHNIKL